MLSLDQESSFKKDGKNLDIFTTPSGRWHVGIFATRDILPLEEITFSYSNGRSRGDGFASSDPCHCGAASCTGRIAEPPKKYQKRCSFANRTSKKMKAKDKSTRNPVKNKKKQNGGFLRKPRRRQELEVAESDVLKGMDSTPETEKTLVCPFLSPEDDLKTDPDPKANNCETEVVEVDEDIIEVDDEIDTHQNINQNRATEQFDAKPDDEDETLQDLLSATKVQQGHDTFVDSRHSNISNHQEMHGGTGIISTWSEAPFDKERPCQEEQSIALSLGLYLPSALRRAMSSRGI